jgi:X-X-X-Leu-X-X-Gly heptad repeat protein
MGAFTPIYGIMMANSIFSLFGGGGVGPTEFSQAIVTISDGIVTAATKFNSSSVAFQGGPKKEWAEGVGLAIGAFAPVYQVLAANSGWFKSGVSVEDMKNAIMTISQGIVDAANFFGANSAAFDISKAPSKEWAEGVGGAIKAFTPALDFISKNTGIFSSGTEIIISALSATTMGIVMAANNLAFGRFDKQIPEEWMKNVSNNVKTYVDLAKYIIDSEADDLDIEDVTDGMVELANGYALLADGVAKLNTQLEQIDIEKLTALKNLTGSIVLLSLMDSDQFEDMMDALEDKAQIFIDVMNDLDKSAPEKVKGGTKGAPAAQVRGKAAPTGPPAKTMGDLYSIMQQVNQNLANIAKTNDNMSKYVDEIRSSDIDLKKKK